MSARVGCSPDAREPIPKSRSVCQRQNGAPKSAAFVLTVMSRSAPSKSRAPGLGRGLSRIQSSRSDPGARRQSDPLRVAPATNVMFQRWARAPSPRGSRWKGKNRQARQQGSGRGRRAPGSSYPARSSASRSFHSPAIRRGRRRPGLSPLQKRHTAVYIASRRGRDRAHRRSRECERRGKTSGPWCGKAARCGRYGSP